MSRGRVRLTDKHGRSRVGLLDGQVIFRVVQGTGHSRDGRLFNINWVIHDGRKHYVRRINPEPPAVLNGVWLSYREYDCEKCRNRGWVIGEKGGTRPCRSCHLEWFERGESK